MADKDHQIIHLLTESRDAQREELAYRRRVLEESLGLQRRAVRNQRIAVVVGLGLVLAASAAAGLLVVVSKQASRASIVQPQR